MLGVFASGHERSRRSRQEAGAMAALFVTSSFGTIRSLTPEAGI